MKREELLKAINRRIQTGRDFDAQYSIHGIPYTIIFQTPDPENDISFPSMIAIPMVKADKIGKQMILETNTRETNIMDVQLEHAMEIGMNLIRIVRQKPSVVVVPLIPSEIDSPYYQQLSKECFEQNPGDKTYRIDEQIVRLIEKAKRTVRKTNGIDLEDKIFLNGYSSSGVFAQRFALLHPDLISAVCIGGASGSIPIPNKEFDYPIGIADFEELTGKQFDMESYKKIAFTYYVGELEGDEKDYTRFDEYGNPVPMHDMSYLHESVPTDVGIKQRALLGKDLLERAQKTVDIVKGMGIKIKHTVVLGREHNNKNGKGIQEIGDKIIDDAYKESRGDRVIEFE